MSLYYKSIISFLAFLAPRFDVQERDSEYFESRCTIHEKCWWVYSSLDWSFFVISVQSSHELREDGRKILFQLLADFGLNWELLTPTGCGEWILRLAFFRYTTISLFRLAFNKQPASISSLQLGITLLKSCISSFNEICDSLLKTIEIHELLFGL